MKDLGKNQPGNLFGSQRTPHINNMLTLVAFPTIWASTSRDLANVHIVNVACSASYINSFFGGLASATSSSVNDKHPKK